MDEFRVPLLVDSNGLYITEAQMMFWINQKGGEDAYITGDPKFLDYYRNCCLYNVIYDMMEDDPDCATMYWDEKKQEVAMAFPMEGKVAKALSDVTFAYDEYEDEEEDPFGIF